MMSRPMMSWPMRFVWNLKCKCKWESWSYCFNHNRNSSDSSSRRVARFLRSAPILSSSVGVCRCFNVSAVPSAAFREIIFISTFPRGVQRSHMDFTLLRVSTLSKHEWSTNEIFILTLRAIFCAYCAHSVCDLCNPADDANLSRNKFKQASPRVVDVQRVVSPLLIVIFHASYFSFLLLPAAWFSRCATRVMYARASAIYSLVK